MLALRMKAIRVSRPGGPEVMEFVEVPVPSPGPGEALVRVEAAGVNFIDVNHRSGAYPRELPFTLGEEGAGVVESLGARSARRAPGRPRGLGERDRLVCHARRRSRRSPGARFPRA